MCECGSVQRCVCFLLLTSFFAILTDRIFSMMLASSSGGSWSREAEKTLCKACGWSLCSCTAAQRLKSKLHKCFIRGWLQMVHWTQQKLWAVRNCVRYNKLRSNLVKAASETVIMYDGLTPEAECKCRSWSSALTWELCLQWSDNDRI